MGAAIYRPAHDAATQEANPNTNNGSAGSTGVLHGRRASADGSVVNFYFRFGLNDPALTPELDKVRQNPALLTRAQITLVDIAASPVDQRLKLELQIGSSAAGSGGNPFVETTSGPDAGITWNNAPTAYGISELGGAFSLGTFNKGVYGLRPLACLNAVKLILGMQVGITPPVNFRENEFRVEFKDDGTYTVDFATSENATQANRPILALTWAGEPGEWMPEIGGMGLPELPILTPTRDKSEV